MTDHQGSVIGYTNASGVSTWINTYDEYGRPGPGNGHYLQYTGQLAIAGSWGVQNYRNRFYNARLGRFMQTDPIGYGDGLNMYAYVGNDPMNRVDPWGLCTSGVTGGGWAVSGDGQIDAAEQIFMLCQDFAGRADGGYGWALWNTLNRWENGSHVGMYFESAGYEAIGPRADLAAPATTQCTLASWGRALSYSGGWGSRTASVISTGFAGFGALSSIAGSSKGMLFASKVLYGAPLVALTASSAIATVVGGSLSYAAGDPVAGRAAFSSLGVPSGRFPSFGGEALSFGSGLGADMAHRQMEQPSDVPPGCE